jgi:hypothetical protein
VRRSHEGQRRVRATETLSGTSETVFVPGLVREFQTGTEEITGFAVEAAQFQENLSGRRAFRGRWTDEFLRRIKDRTVGNPAIGTKSLSDPMLSVHTVSLMIEDVAQ